MTTPLPVEAPESGRRPIADLREDAKEFYNRGLISNDALQELLYEINTGTVRSDADLVSELHIEVSNQHKDGMSSRQRKELHALAEETLEDLDLPKLDKSWEGGEMLSTKIMNGPMRFLGDLVGGIVPGVQLVPDEKVATHGTHAQRKEQEADEFRDFKAAFAKDLLASNAITDKQYNELVRAGLYDPEKSLGEIMDMLGDDFDIADNVLEQALRQSSTATLRRKNKDMEALERAEEQAETVNDIVTSEEKLDALKAYERLEETKPGKYVYDATRGRIYEVGTGQLVNNNGKVVDPTDPAYENVPTDDMFWDEAGLMVTPWDEYQIDEDSYYSLIDVVENPTRYHQGGIERFASGEQFIGGFASDYGVAQSQELQRQIRDERIGQDRGIGGSLRRGMGEYAWQSWTQDIQEVRRPWYDQGDNWALYAGKSPEAIAVEQQKLVSMGALEENDVVSGQWGPAEAAALQKMMTIANGRAEKIEDISVEFWDEFWASESSGGAAAQRRAFVAPTYQKLDPARAQLTVEETVRRLLGRDATEDELADLGVHMADMHRQSFQADVQALRQEYDAETRAIDTQAPQSGGEVQDVDWEARFQQKFNERNEAELARFDRTQDRMQRQQIIGGAMNSFMQTLGGGIGGGSLGGR